MYGFDIRITGELGSCADAHAENVRDMTEIVADFARFLQSQSFGVACVTLNGREVILRKEPPAQHRELPPRIAISGDVLDSVAGEIATGYPPGCLGEECAKGPSDCHAAGRCLAEKPE